MADRIDNFKGKEGQRFGSGQEPVESGKKGGIASGAARRRKGAAKKLLTTILAAKPAELTATWKRTLTAMGMDPEADDITNEILSMAALYKQTVKGNVQAIKLQLEILGEDPETLREKERNKIRKDAVEAIRNSDGFIEALSGTAEEVFADGGDTPDAIEDSE